MESWRALSAAHLICPDQQEQAHGLLDRLIGHRSGREGRHLTALLEGVLSFILHIAILGILAYQPKEIALQGGLTLILLIGRLWLAFAIQLMVLAVNCYLIINGKHLLDVTEAFRQVAMARNIK
eukprot:jgi/Astpho2/6197/Aster-x1354